MSEFEDRGKVGWIHRLTGKQKTKDEIAQGLRAHAEEWKREEPRGLGVPSRSRSVSVATAEKKETRRKSLDMFSRAGVMILREEGPKRKEVVAEKPKPVTEVEKAFAKAKEAEERAVAAKLEATRLIAEANKALAAAAAAKAEASTPVQVHHLPAVEESHSESCSAVDADKDSIREDSEKKGEERGLSSISTSSTFNLSSVIGEDMSNNDLSSRTFFSFNSSKKTGHNHEEDVCRTASASVFRISEKETKLRLEHANTAEKAAKKAIKNAAKLKHEAELTIAKALEIENREKEKALKRQAKGVAVTKLPPLKKDVDASDHNNNNNSSFINNYNNSESPSLLRSNSSVGLDRSPSSNSLSCGPSLTLNEVLATENGVAAFKEFAAEGFVLENVSFVLEIRAFDLLEEGTESWLKRAHEIYETYVKVGSPQEVNMTSKIRNDVVEHFEGGTLEPGIFKGLAGEVLRILRTNDWPRFVKSEQYKRLEAATMSSTLAPSTPLVVATTTATPTPSVLEGAVID